jgi:hypothetical protein
VQAGTGEEAVRRRWAAGGWFPSYQAVLCTLGLLIAHLQRTPVAKAPQLGASSWSLQTPVQATTTSSSTWHLPALQSPTYRPSHSLARHQPAATVRWRSCNAQCQLSDRTYAQKCTRQTEDAGGCGCSPSASRSSRVHTCSYPHRLSAVTADISHLHRDSSSVLCACLYTCTRASPTTF